ncbi:MAG: asparagine synthase (glutamine-hydrolyzing) [Burkholderiales bacterium]
MCGIAGFFAQRPVVPNVPRDMLDALRPRGPDAQHSVFWDERFQLATPLATNALLHARLAIRDPRPVADQPMHNDAKDIWICYNGEVYGWEQEAQQLATAGHRFHTRSDTEFILRGYEAWGIEALIPKLRGMFALVILDLREHKLHVVRDRLGLKPLVYYYANGEFAFGSTVRSVLPFVPLERRGFSHQGIDAYLTHRYIPAPRTIFSTLRRLENGHRLCFDLNTRTLEQKRYWRPSAEAGDWRAELDNAIGLRTASDRPVGLFLSGGVDSAVIAARLNAQGYGNIATFTAAFPGTAFDESAQAAGLAMRLGMPNHRIEIQDELRRDFATLVRDLDEPFADPSCIPAWYLARATVKQATVVLGGDGGDELFGGYKRYSQHLRSAWRRGLRIPYMFQPSLHLTGSRKLMAEGAMSWEHAYALRFSGFAPWQRAALQPEFAERKVVYWRSEDNSSLLSPRAALVQIDFDNYLPEYILRKADLCTMAHGLELRAPLLDHLFVQRVLALSDSDRFTDPPKRLLASAAPEAQPALLRKKRGFNPPLKQWLHQDLADHVEGLGARLTAHSGAQLNAQCINQLAARYYAGEEHFAEQLLQLLILDESLAQLTVLARANADG